MKMITINYFPFFQQHLDTHTNVQVTFTFYALKNIWNKNIYLKKKKL